MQGLRLLRPSVGIDPREPGTEWSCPSLPTTTNSWSSLSLPPWPCWASNFERWTSMQMAVGGSEATGWPTVIELADDQFPFRDRRAARVYKPGRCFTFVSRPLRRLSSSLLVVFFSLLQATVTLDRSREHHTQQDNRFQAHHVRQ